MSSKPHIRRPKGERIAEILDAARSEFTAKGYLATTMADISSRVGIVEGAIYRHFKGKRDILERLLADYYSVLIADVEAQLPGITGARNRLRFLVWRHLTAFADDPEYCWLVVRQVRPDAPLYESSVHGFNRRYTGYCVHVVEEGIASGEFRADISPTIVRDLAYGAVEHVMWRYLLSGAAVDVEATADKITDMIVRGIELPVPQGSPLEGLADRLENAVGRLEKLTQGGSE